ncbi:hypothetical protein [Nocardia sp. NPDC048505]|uniref:hypothetical protein n=1 Tax=unclassified Nocardia TaxID=2637762 RepID=UPI0033CCC48B
MSGSSDSRRPVDSFLLVLGTTADALSILTFVGIPTSQYALRFGVVLALSVVGTVLVASSLFTAVRRLVVFDGSYYTVKFHRNQIVKSVVTLVGSVVLAVFLLLNIPHNQPANPPPQPSSSTPPLPGAS